MKVIPDPEVPKSSKDLKDLIIIFLVICLVIMSASIFDLFDSIKQYTIHNDAFNFIELLFFISVFSLAASVFAFRRWSEKKREINKHLRNEEVLRDNEKRLLATVDLSPDTITIHKDKIIVFTNRAGVYLLGANSQEEILGLNILDIIHEDYVDIIEDRIERMNRGFMKLPNIEIKIKRLDNTIINAEIASTLITYHEIPHIITIIRDISDRIKNQEKLKESEERIQDILDNSTAVVFMKDLYGNYLLVNHQFETLFNVSRDKIKYQNDYDIFPKALADVFRENDKKVLEIRKPLTVEEVAPHADGLHTYLSVKFPLFNSYGLAYAVCGMATDITERKKTEETKSRLASIVESSDDAITSYDLDGNILTWNPGAEYIYGYTTNEIIGKNVQILIPSELEKELSFILNKIQNGERVDDYETQRLTKDKKVLDISLTVSPIKDDKNNITAASSISRDITYKKAVEKEMRRYAEELALYNEELYVFSYAASHDLQEPLKNIQSFINELKEKYYNKLDKHFDEIIDNADDGTLRMYRLITDFLTYSRVNADTSKYEKTDINNILKESLKNLDSAIKTSKIKVTSTKLPTIFCNSLQFVQVFQNLISNAIKYKSEKKPAVKIKAEDQGQFWLFSVTDNGIGIEQWYHERIFIIFQKLHDPQKYPGSGIGLALCKRVIEKHGGKIWFESEPGKGTTFYFTVPKEEKK